MMDDDLDDIIDILNKNTDKPPLPKPKEQLITVKEENRSQIIARIRKDLGGGKSCRTRMLDLLLSEMAISLFSKQYFKLHFYNDILLLAQDAVPNIRLKLCGILPRLKSVLTLPSDHVLLQQLEDTIEKLVLFEKDTDVLQAVQKSIHDLVSQA